MTAAVLATVTFSASDADAAAGCNQDGVAGLCVDTRQSQDAWAIVYQVTQADGPGTYTVYYVDTSTGMASAPRTIGPLAYQATVSGTFLVPFNHCYNVHLDSVAGTSVVAGTVCG